MQTCRSRLAGDGGFKDAIAGKPAPTRMGAFPILRLKRRTCRSRLAGDGGFKDAIASKPGSYKNGGAPRSSVKTPDL